MRLTKKMCNGEYLHGEASGYSTEICLEKLGQLEDIEEELGIDLITLFKALRNRVFTINQPPSYFPVRVSLQIGGYGDAITAYLIRRYDNDNEEEVCRLKDYGKTWALTKEELL